MLLRLIVILLTLLILPDIYIYMVYVKSWTKSVKWRILCWLPSLLLLVAMVTIMASDSMRASNQPIIGMFLVVFLSICVAKAFFAIIDGIGHLFRQQTVRRVFRILAMTVAMFSFMMHYYGYFIGRSKYVVHKQTFYFTDLPKRFDGYRIVHFSDMHLGTFLMGHENEVVEIVDLINSQHADAIIFSGDIVNHQADEMAPFGKALGALKAPDGVFSVLGNHDYCMYRKYADKNERKREVERIKKNQRSYGWNLLLNENIVIHRGADSLAVIGVENTGKPPFPSYGNLSKAMNGLSDSCFSVLITHDPSHWRSEVIRKTYIQLTLSGHTHAGQFKVFGWSPVASIYKEWSGAYCEGSQILNVSEGIGSVLFPFRFGAWPEINVITLRKAEGKH